MFLGSVRIQTTPFSKVQPEICFSAMTMILLILLSMQESWAKNHMTITPLSAQPTFSPVSFSSYKIHVSVYDLV
jgi:hypothetical protein